MNGPILNAADLGSIDANSAELPQMTDAMLNYFQPMVFTQIVKSVVNFKNVETPTNTAFQGVMQPFTAQQLLMKDIGQRAWRWNMLHADPTLILSPDDVILYKNIQYRVKDKFDYSSYGYLEYHLVEDYSGSGPNS